MPKLSGLVVFGITLAGCASEESFQKATSEFTNCSADNVQISDVNTSGDNSWKAICKSDARIYKCNRDGCTEIK
jgi:hypothetical protein